MTKREFITSILLLPTFLFGQKQEKLTASQILDFSLVFCGGEQRISKINTTSINYLLIQADKTTAIVNDQLRIGEKYVQSILSKTHYPQTTFFDGDNVTRVDSSSIVRFTNIKAKEEVKLKTYNQIQYGYKQLRYKLSRLPDQKFRNFDCFVINAKADNGYTTMNFFDKMNFRLLMVVYPNGNKSLMLEYIYKDSVLFNSLIINTFSNSDDIQTLKLNNVDINSTISDTWFNCPYKDSVITPPYIKTGKFASTNGAETKFTRTETSMNYNDENGKIILRRFLIWGLVSPDSFSLIDEEALRNNDKSSKNQILVRIVSWDKSGYVCQWITDTQTDTQDYKLIK